MLKISEKDFWDFPMEKRRKFIGIIEFDDRFLYIKNQKSHRMDGPAVIYKNENLFFYYIDGVQMTKEEYEFYLDLLRLKKLL